jgi:hypothetical protein
VQLPVHALADPGKSDADAERNGKRYSKWLADRNAVRRGICDRKRFA